MHFVVEHWARARSKHSRPRDSRRFSRRRNPDPAGRHVDFTGGSIAAGIGFSWGHGTLNFGGQSHAFKISGVSLVDVGAANISASGTVYNLKNLADFNGNFVAVAAGMTVAGGGSAAYLKNEHGVVIKLHSTEAGLRLNLSADGLKVALAS